MLYFRDGQKFFASFTGAVAQLASDATPHIPELIVVGIVETDRVRDSSATHSLKGFTGKDDSDYASSGGGQAFLRFLEQELVPYVDQNFRTSGYRIYGGYSFTGLSVLTALFDDSSSFHAYIAIDPSWWWDDYAMERAARAALATRKFARVQLFMATSGERYPTRYFSYQPTLDELYNRPEQLAPRYDQLSARLAEQVALSEGLLNFFGGEFLHTFHEPEKAARYFELNARYYPRSPGVWNSLGELYAARGDTRASVRMYEKALALDPDDETAARQLRQLREK